VVFQGSKDDTNELAEAQTGTQAGGISDEREVQVATKTKRRIIKPAYLNDYV